MELRRQRTDGIFHFHQVALIIDTVGENIIATIKIRNNYGAIQSLKFPILG